MDMLDSLGIQWQLLAIQIVPLVIVPAILAIWIASDARKRGSLWKQYIIWAIIVFFFSIIGLIIYLLTDHRKPIVTKNAISSDEVF